MTPAAPDVETAPAGGAATLDLVLGTAVSGAVITTILLLGLLHRSGRSTLLARAGGRLSRASGLPPWVALPALIAVVAYLSAGVGFVWDVAIHINNGRDEGPFGTPAHFFMLAGIYGFVAASWFALTMPTAAERGRSWVRITRTWHAPVGAVVMLSTSLIATMGFPADDLWHRLFGQDVTLWGPTHQMMICGGLFAYAGLMMLGHEGLTAAHAAGGDARALRAWRRIGAMNLCVVGLVGMTVAWQQEFAFGVPQFRLLFQPLMIVVAAALVLVAARAAMGRGAALNVAVQSALVLGALTVVVGPVLGQSTHHFPIYVAEALLVEAAFLVGARWSPFRAAALAGVLVGSAGVVAEWGWSHLWMPVSWPGHLVPEAIAWGVPLGIAAALIGRWVTAGFSTPPATALVRAWRAPALGLAAIVGAVVLLVPASAPSGLTARVAVTEVTGGPERTAHVTVRLSDPAVADRPDWFVGFAWQGGEDRSVVEPLREIADGVWRTTEPLPLHGTWKTGLRLHDGGTMAMLPLSLPADAALGLPAVASSGTFERTFAADREILQRERDPDVPGWLFAAATIVVGAVIVAMLLFMGWALARIAGVGPGLGRRPRPAVRPGGQAVPASSA